MTGVQRWMRNRLTAGVAALAGVGALVVAVVVLVLAGPAGAQQEPEVSVNEGIECADSNWLLPGGGGKVDLVFTADSQAWADAYVEQARKEAEQGNCNLAEWAPPGPCFRGEQPRHQGALPDRCWGRYPTGSYNITYDQGDLLDIGSKFWGVLTAFTFSIGKQAMQLALWIVGAAFQFDIKEYTGVADSIAGRYDARLVGPLKLRDIAWFALFAYVAVTALRGRLGVAGGEIALSIVMASLAAFLVGHRVGYMNSVANAMDDSSTSLLVAAHDRDPTDVTRADAEMAVLGMQSVLHEQFVEVPYHFVNWGSVPEGVCQDRAEFILTAGLQGDGGWSERYMRDENGASDEACAEPATWNHNPNPERFGAALVSTVIAVTIALVIGLTALTLFVGKFLVAVMFAVVPFAAAAAVLPGTGRRLAWGWLSTTGQGVLVFVGSAGVVSLGGLGIAGVTQLVPEDRPWDRSLLIFAVVVLLFVIRRRVLAGSQSAASGLSDHLTRMSPASANWQGGTAGFDLSGMDRNTTRALSATAKLGAWGTGAAVIGTAGMAGRSVTMRLRERRQARRSMRNLEAMERRREAPQLEWKHDTRPSPTKLTFQGSGGRRGGGPGGQTPRPTLLGRLTGRSQPGAAPASGGGEGFDFEGKGEQLGPSGGRYPNITMKVRAPRSYRPTASDVFHPSRLISRPIQATADRVRIARKEQSFQRTVRNHLDEHEVRNLGLRRREDWHLGPRHGWSARDLAPGRTSQRGFNRTTGAREGFSRQPLPLGPLRRLIPAHRQWQNRGPSKWRRGNQ